MKFTCVSIIAIMLLSVANAQHSNFTRSVIFGVGSRIIKCGATSNFVTSDMKNPDNVNSDCVYTFRPNSLRVCQLRIDFDTLILAPPTNGNKNYANCGHDALLAGGFEICGNNFGSHFYIPWNVQRATDRIDVTLKIADRAVYPTLPAPRWLMKVTQIECQEKGSLVRHNKLRAPEGCRQYHIEPTGIIESFNAYGEQGPYLGMMDYAICIARRPQDTQLILTPIFFQMSKLTTVATEYGYDTDCSPQTPSKNAKQDYLGICEGETKDPVVADVVANRFCGKSITVGTQVITRAPGPFVLRFSSDEQTDPDRATNDELGFQFRYQLSA